MALALALPNLRFLSRALPGIVLLADIVPTAIIQPCAPFFLSHWTYTFRVSLAILFALAAFLLVGSHACVCVCVYVGVVRVVVVVVVVVVGVRGFGVGRWGRWR